VKIKSTGANSTLASVFLKKKNRTPSRKTSGCEKTLFFPKDVVFDASILQFKAH
jgi:hypothetical protein